jgi:hypothetical protein
MSFAGIFLALAGIWAVCFFLLARAHRRRGMLHAAAITAEYARYLRDFHGDHQGSEYVLQTHTLILDAYYLDRHDKVHRDTLRTAAGVPLRQYLSTR